MKKTATEGRSLKSLFVRPGAQFKVFFLAAGLGQLILSLTFISYLYFIDYLVTSGVEITGTDPGSMSFLDSLFWMRIVIVVMTAIILGVSFIIVSLMTYRIYGPTVPILRMIESLKQGQYGQTRNLRKSDELKNVMDELNELSQILKKRHP